MSRDTRGLAVPVSTRGIILDLLSFVSQGTTYSIDCSTGSATLDLESVATFISETVKVQPKAYVGLSA